MRGGGAGQGAGGKDSPHGETPSGGAVKHFQSSEKKAIDMTIWEEAAMGTCNWQIKKGAM